MELQRNKVCGVDVHKKFLVATSLSRDGIKETKRFSIVIEDLLRFKDWVIENNCEQVAVESTGIYWYPIHAVLEGKIDLIVANAYKIKHTPGRKTDASDSEWIAELCLNGMIEPSRIFPKEDRELRRLTRARESYVKEITQEKNKIHHALDSSCIKLASVLSDIFGRSGRYILSCLMEGKSVEDIIEGLPTKRIKKKADLIREAIVSSLEVSQIIQIRGSLKLIVFDSDRPIRSTRDMRTWYTGKPCEYTKKSHINFCVYDSTWEMAESLELDRNPKVEAWVKNDHLGFEIAYFYQGVIKKYWPDFIIRLNNGINLVLEVKGRDTLQDKTKRSYLDEWVRAINEHGGFGVWQWAVSKDPADITGILNKCCGKRPGLRAGGSSGNRHS